MAAEKPIVTIFVRRTRTIFSKDAQKQRLSQKVWHWEASFCCAADGPIARGALELQLLFLPSALAFYS
jgi:hypothetical protein